MTEVESDISNSGWAFAILCCLLGSWLVSCLVNCMPGFRRYIHFCPCCKSIIGVGEPKHSGADIAIIIVSVLLAIGFIAAYVYFKVFFGQ